MRRVWVHEVGILHAKKDTIAMWEVWDTYNTRQDAVQAMKREFTKRPSWVTAKFHKATNRIRKYVPAK